MGRAVVCADHVNLIWIADVLRIAAGVLLAATASLQLSIIIMAWYVLRPAHKLGFLWWHILAVALSSFGLAFVAVSGSWGRFGLHITWHLPATMFFLSLHLTALVIIYRVERARFAEKRAASRA